MRFNTVKVVDGVIRRLAVIEQALPGYRFQVITNQGTFIKNAIGEVKSSAVLGIILAVVILFVFLRRLGTTLIVSLAILISIVATFNLMFFNHLTLNIMTLGGLALGAGMLVDNAIVVIESIFRNQEKGMTIREAAIAGTSEVAGAVIASTLTTIVVFLPIVYLHGASGELFKDQAWTVTFSLVSSLFVAILVIPMLYDRITGRQDRGAGGGTRGKRHPDYRLQPLVAHAAPPPLGGDRLRFDVAGDSGVVGSLYRYGVYAEPGARRSLPLSSCRKDSVGAYRFGCR